MPVFPFRSVPATPAPSSFEAEALAHAGALYRTARRVTRNPTDADDLVQDTYLKAFRAAGTFERGSNLRAWLFTILMNTWRNRRRDAGRDPVAGASAKAMAMASVNIIHDLERRQMDAISAKRRVPEFAPGDTVKVMVKVIEEADQKDKKGKAAKDAPKTPTVRLQAYEGVVISRSGGGINESFTVRKISYGEGVERVFPIYSPYIAEIEVLRRGKVRRAKLYYLRGRRGKSARIFERTDARAKRLNAAFKGFKRPKGEPDDLTKIKGVNAELVAKLHGLGVIKFDQLANFSDDDIANVDEALTLNGRIEKDDWVSQAQALVAEAAAAEVPAEEPKK